MQQLREAAIHPVAIITGGNSDIFVTNLLDNSNNPIILAMKKKIMERNIRVMDILSTYGRERMPTLFGKFVNNKFVQDDNITIRIYKNSAYNILEHGSEQYGALQDVKDAIRRLSQKDRDVNEKNDQGI